MKPDLAAVLNEILTEEFPGESVVARVEGGTVFLEGEVADWRDVFKAGHLVGKKPGVESVVNNLKPRSLPRRVQGRPWISGRKRRFLERCWGRLWPPLPEEAEVVIIGGGMVGCSIARELSRYKVDVVLLEMEADVGCGASKANNGWVHPGIDPEPGTLKARLCVRGNAMYDQVAYELDVPFNRCGLLVVATHPEELSYLEDYFQRGVKNGVPGMEWLSREEILQLEPNLTLQVVAGFRVPTLGIISPYKLTIAYAENAVANGARVFLGTKATGILCQGDRVVGVQTGRGVIRCSWVVNAAGIFADEVAAMAGGPEFSLYPRKGELLIFDKEHADFLRHGLLTVKTDPYTKGGGANISDAGNMLWGPTAEEVPFKDDVTVSTGGIQAIIGKFGELLPGFPTNSLITSFAGVRAAAYTEDYYIQPSRRVRGIIHVAGIQSPGLASTPAIAEMVLELLKDAGLTLVEKEGFNPRREDIFHFSAAQPEDKRRLLRSNPQYGRVVCRCEQVTEAEIVQAIRRPVPALTVDAIKRRTRAGMGRCQGGFCGPRVVQILARELGLPVEWVSKDGLGSELFAGRTKGEHYGGGWFNEGRD